MITRSGVGRRGKEDAGRECESGGSRFGTGYNKLIYCLFVLFF